MAALDFPASPTDGQVYGNWIWNAAKGAWKAKPLTAMKATPSDTAPLNPANGDEWLNTIDGCLYVYYTDVDGSQWVQVKNDASFTSTLGPRVDAMEANDNRNVIINGAFDIWQRGTSFSNPADGAYVADRWVLSHNGTGATRTISQQTFTPGAAPVAGYEGTYFLRYDTSVIGTGNTYQVISQRIEDVRTLSGQMATVSFWAKGSSTRSTFVQLTQVFGSGGSSTVYTSAGTASVTTGWQRFSFTVNVPSVSGKTIGSGSYLIVELHAGGAVSGQLDIWGVQLQAGAVATAFHRNAPSLQAELAACQRYYYRQTAANPYSIFGYGNGMGSSSTEFVVPFPVTMRVTPTGIDNSNIGGGTPGVITLNPSSLSYQVGKSGTNAGSVSLTSTNNASSGSFVFLWANNTTNAYLGFNAEL